MTLAAATAARPGWWARGPHMQTVWAGLARSRRLITFTREILTTPDGDDLVLDHTDGPPGAPRVILLHGTEGSAYSLHTQGLTVLVARAGWRCTVLNFRSCARDPRNIRVRLENRAFKLLVSARRVDRDRAFRPLAPVPRSPCFYGETQSKPRRATSLSRNCPRSSRP
jgi:predicted alpha/beta-fold hydrolase